MSADAELFRPVPTHPGFFASTEGRLLGPRGMLRPMRMPSGHLYVLTYRGSPRKLFVHRAVLLAFAGAPPLSGHECRHLDGNPANNRLENLAWGSRIENVRDRARHGTEPRGEAKACARLTRLEAEAIRVDERASREVARAYGVSHTTVLAIRRGRLWRVA